MSNLPEQAARLSRLWFPVEINAGHGARQTCYRQLLKALQQARRDGAREELENVYANANWYKGELRIWLKKRLAALEQPPT